MQDSVFDRDSTIELLKFSDDLPSLPDRFIKIQNIVQDPNAGADDLTAVIRSDQATSAMILKIANSAAYNPTHTPIGELSKAIARLGSKETTHIASAMSLMYGLVLPTGMANIRAFWTHAFAVATVAETLAKQIDPAQQQCRHERIFMMGLLHDIGRAALGMRVDFSYFEHETGHLRGDELIAAERERYGLDHAEAGAMLLQLWLFPDDLCEGVANHHKEDAESLLARACFLANEFANAHISNQTPFDQIPETVKQALTEHPVDSARLIL